MSLDLLVAKLRLVGGGTAPQVDRDANKFFANTLATDGIKTLIREVFSRLISKNERIANIAEGIMAMSNIISGYTGMMLTVDSEQSTVNAVNSNLLFRC